MVSLTSQIVTGTGHGWNILQGPFLVSESEKQTINSLNYSPAFSIYKDAIENESHYSFNDQNFFDIAKHFPLGIADLNNQLVVRDPILTHDGSIHCVGDIPVNSMVYLLKGSTASLLASANQAAKSATTKIDGKDFTVTMVFDCISRMLYMENSFSQELELITKQCSKQIFLVCSL
ncbi:FIST C-terminal domain-containing protein [Colwellia sp. MSW7]|uniref:FIST C-terminal domain-containing protein n=1 Tax=Colwellia maritima TaxID=2912588 RepID=A0ABS9X943_9GAMM|nr:FIST C-terminal domain-containing protein [Colwellia maritima]MCI2285587.1 FIST C-terminal domain-containing protein [Colwellia maritima]